MDKKVALLLTGGLRNFEDTFKSFNHFLLNDLDIDVFFYGLENNNGIELNEEKFVELYNPKDYVINTNKFYDDIPVNPSYIKSSYFSFYNVYKCNQLKNEYSIKNDIKYDLVIRCRLDVFWFRSISTEELDLSNNMILTPIEWSFKQINPFALSDIFCITNEDNMDKYCNLYNKINEYCTILKFHPESLIGYHIKKEKLPYIEIPRHFVFEYPTKKGENHIPNEFNFIEYFEKSTVNRKDFD